MCFASDNTMLPNNKKAVPCVLTSAVLDKSYNEMPNKFHGMCLLHTIFIDHASSFSNWHEYRKIIKPWMEEQNMRNKKCSQDQISVNMTDYTHTRF